MWVMEHWKSLSNLSGTSFAGDLVDVVLAKLTYVSLLEQRSPEVP